LPSWLPPFIKRLLWRNLAANPILQDEARDADETLPQPDRWQLLALDELIGGVAADLQEAGGLGYSEQKGFFC
jgi:hypothetical protein